MMLLKKTKTVLSANNETPIHIQGLLEDIDYAGTITREDFYQMCKEEKLFERILEPLNDAISKSKLNKQDIEAITLVGGGTRIPQIRDILTDYLGNRKLREDLNAEEAPAFGAAFRAANISSAFRVRGVALEDITPFPIGVRLRNLNEQTQNNNNNENNENDQIVSSSNENEDNNDNNNVNNNNNNKIFSRRASLFSVNNHVFRRKAVTIKHDEDLYVSLWYEKYINNLPMDTSNDLGGYEITGIKDSIQKYMKSTLDNGQLKYNITELPKISLSFLLDASGIVDMISATAIYTETITDNTVINDKSDSEKKENNENGNTASTTKDEKEKENKTFQTKHKVNLNIKRIFPQDVKPYSSSDLDNSRKVLLELDERDRVVVEIADSRNELEAYIYDSKSRLEDNVISKVSTKEDREQFQQMLESTEDWIMSNEEENVSTYKSKLRELKEIGQPIFIRAKELIERPKIIEMTNKSIKKLHEYIDLLINKYPWININETYKLSNNTLTFETWYQNKLKEQENKTPLDNPAFLSTEITSKLEQLFNHAEQLLSRKKPQYWDMNQRKNKKK